MPLGVLIAGFLWVNEFPDYKADAGAGKKNVVVRLGRCAAAKALPLIYVLAYGLLAAAPFVTGIRFSVWLGLIAVPFSLMACVWTLREPESFYRSKPVQPFALLFFAVYSLGVSGGLLLV